MNIWFASMQLGNGVILSLIRNAENVYFHFILWIIKITQNHFLLLVLLFSSLELVKNLPVKVKTPQRSPG